MYLDVRVYLELSLLFMMELFCEGTEWQNISMIDVWKGSKYPSMNLLKEHEL